MTKEKCVKLNPDYEIDECNTVEELIDLTDLVIKTLVSRQLTKAPSNTCVINISNQDHENYTWVFNQKHKLIDMSEELLRLASNIGSVKNNWYDDSDSVYIGEFLDLLGFEDVNEETTILYFNGY